MDMELPKEGKQWNRTHEAGSFGAIGGWVYEPEDVGRIKSQTEPLDQYC
jgi:hypothetical protein